MASNESTMIAKAPTATSLPTTLVTDNSLVDQYHGGEIVDHVSRLAQSNANISPYSHQLLLQACYQLKSQQKSTTEDQQVQGSPNVRDSKRRKRVDRPILFARHDYYGPRTHFGDQQSDPRRRIRIQTSYLDALALCLPTTESLKMELKAKEALRVRLARIAQAAIAGLAETSGFAIAPDTVDFKCFGSLRSGFALPGADVNLAMATRTSFPPGLLAKCPRILEKAFLDAGYGAYLIVTAKFVVVRLCEQPSKELLEFLREGYKAREGTEATGASGQSTSRGFIGVTPGSEDTTTPNLSDQSGIRRFEFPESGVGIQCEISFSGILALYNSELLRCYALCDHRVRSVGLFVKKWAKARKINDPCRGTLCSYGYILMVIHYLMNVAKPPLIPNLQINYRPPPPGKRSKNATMVDGCDIRFFNDESEIKARAGRNALTGNRQSTGGFLRGFFEYYGTSGRNTPLGGFVWSKNVVSIRTRGGILTKSEKGWTGAKVDQNGNKSRFLIAIEDPFRIDHNVAETVCYTGYRAIRDEFRRAYTIINRIQRIPGAGWEWRTDEGDVGEFFFAEAEVQLQLLQGIHDWRETAPLHATPGPLTRDGQGPDPVSTISTTARNDDDPKLSTSTPCANKNPYPLDSILIPLSQQTQVIKGSGMKPQIPSESRPQPTSEIAMPVREKQQPTLSEWPIKDSSNSETSDLVLYSGAQDQEVSRFSAEEVRVDLVDAKSIDQPKQRVGQEEQTRPVPHQTSLRPYSRSSPSKQNEAPKADIRMVVAQANAYQLNPRIRPLVPDPARREEANRLRLRQQTAVCAKVMRRILHMPESSNVHRSLTVRATKSREASSTNPGAAHYQVPKLSNTEAQASDNVSPYIHPEMVDNSKLHSPSVSEKDHCETSPSKNHAHNGQSARTDGDPVSVFDQRIVFRMDREQFRSIRALHFEDRSEISPGFADGSGHSNIKLNRKTFSKHRDDLIENFAELLHILPLDYA